MGGDEVVGCHLPFEELANRSRMLLEELRAHDQLGRDELALGPQRGLIDQNLPAALIDETGSPWLGDPRSRDATAPERFKRLCVLLGDDRGVATAFGVGVDAVVLEPVAQCNILGAAKLWRGDLLALEVGSVGDAWLHDEEGAARSRAGDDADGVAIRLHERVDRRVRADVGA